MFPGFACTKVLVSFLRSPQAVAVRKGFDPPAISCRHHPVSRLARGHADPIMNEPQTGLCSVMGRHVRETCTIPDIGTNFLDERSYPDDVPVPSFGLRLRCERCGYAGALRVDHGVSANRSHMLTG
jgi:hypothetical protein